MSWARAATGASDRSALQSVQISGLVLLKLQKHCGEHSPSIVSGQLLGLDVGNTLEVTNSFPIPVRAQQQPGSACSLTPAGKKSRAAPEDGEEEADEGSSNFQLEMLRNLREVNVDNNTVGWREGGGGGGGGGCCAAPALR